jgi:predicted GNAT family N-acyltransferase
VPPVRPIRVLLAGRRANFDTSQRPDMVYVREADYESDRAVLISIRFLVFVDEQHVPPSMETDDRDPFCIHLLAFENDEAVGTGRIDLGKGGKIGRVAVLASKRRQGIGAALMVRLHEVAKHSGLSKVWCNAQVAVVPFYKGLGYRVVGETFYEAGIEHVRMEREI